MNVELTYDDIVLLRDAVSIMSPDSEDMRHALDLLYIHLEAQEIYARPRKAPAPKPPKYRAKRGLWRVIWADGDNLGETLVRAYSEEHARREATSSEAWRLTRGIIEVAKALPK